MLAANQSRTTSTKSRVQRPGLIQISLEKVCAHLLIMPAALSQQCLLLVVAVSPRPRPGAPLRKGRHMFPTSLCILSRANSGAGLTILLIIGLLNLPKIQIIIRLLANFIGGLAEEKRQIMLRAARHVTCAFASTSASASSTMSGTWRFDTW